MKFAVHLIDACWHAQASGHRNEEDVAAQTVGHAVAIDAHGLLAQARRVLAVHDAYVLLCPLDELVDVIYFSHLLAEELLVGREPFQFHAWVHHVAAEDVVGVGHTLFIVFQYL